jgi:DNA-binding NarL/FixJ family response regulator
MAVTILIAEDHRILREGLSQLLALQPGFRVVAEADTGRQAVEQACALSPTLVIMDVGLPDLNGVEATRRIRQECAVPPKIIALTARADRKTALEMLQAGAWGYVLKDAPFDELLQAIQLVLRGTHYLCPAVADLLLTDFLAGPGETPGNPASTLTSREREVVQLLAEGQSTKEIAHTLHLSPATVESYRKSIMAKLDLHTVAELTKYAIREGLTNL